MGIYTALQSKGTLNKDAAGWRVDAKGALRSERRMGREGRPKPSQGRLLRRGLHAVL